MASLHIIKGVNQGQTVSLDGDEFILGRNPDCHFVIPITSVSREHARILRLQGKFYIEDKQSRNGTKINNQTIAARTQLGDKDRIQICDFIASFHDAPEKPPLPKEMVRGNQQEEEDGEEEGGAAEDAPLPEATISSQGSHLLLETQPAEKLKALLEISSELSKTLEVDALLPKIVDSLFYLFKQADRGFIILRDDAANRLIPKVIKTRRNIDDSNARFSKSIVRQCMDTLQALLSDDAGSDKRFALSQSVADFRIRSVMCAPLISAGSGSTEARSFGVIQLDTQDRNKKFTQDDLKLLVGVANQAAIAMDNAKLHEAAVASAKVKRDLELAHQVQLSFLPKKLPALPGYEFFSYYESAQEVGGDYYGFIPLPNQRLAITLGDVAGKGVPAALLMAKLSADARFCLMTEDGLAKAISKLNGELCQHASEMDRFVTLAAALLETETGVVTLVSAGHPSPFRHSRATGMLEEVVPRDVAGVPLGMLEDQVYDSCQVTLQPGDSLFLFSDGVPDSYNVRNEAFQIKGIHAALKDGGPFTPKTLGERLVRAVKQHAAGRPQHDDITLVCFGRTLPG